MIQLIIQCDFQYLQLYFYMSELIFLYNNAVQKSMYGSALINLCILKYAFLDKKWQRFTFWERQHQDIISQRTNLWLDLKSKLDLDGNLLLGKSFKNLCKNVRNFYEIFLVRSMVRLKQIGQLTRRKVFSIILLIFIMALVVSRYLRVI